MSSTFVNVSNFPNKNLLKSKLERISSKNYENNCVATNTETIGEYEENGKSSTFIKEYIETTAKKNGINIPKNASIIISAPKEYPKDFKKLLKVVRVDIFKARVSDMFELLTQDINIVEAKVANMKISDKEKKNIIKLKKKFDNYYKVEIKINNEKINLLDCSESTKSQLNKISPQFVKFIEEQPKLKKLTTEFAKKEIERVELAESGTSSRWGATVLLPVLSFMIIKDVYQSRLEKKEMTKDINKFLSEQKEIYEKGNPLLNLYNRICSKFKKTKISNCKSGSLNPFKSLKGSNKNRLIGILGLTLAGSWDDLSGCVKDYFQDENNFGKKAAILIGIPSAVVGVLSSFLIAPMIEDQIKFNRSKNYLIKNKIISKDATKLNSTLKNGGKVAAVGLGACAGIGLIKFVLQLIQGCITTSSSSGSSWGSMAGTRYLFARNGKILADKNIIDKKDNTSKATSKNMMAYEAYKGKWAGISKSDPLLGVLFGGTGLLTHSNPLIQSTAFALQGCSETLTACTYQLLGDKYRQNKIEKEKAILLSKLND